MSFEEAQRQYDNQSDDYPKYHGFNEAKLEQIFKLQWELQNKLVKGYTEMLQDDSLKQMYINQNILAIIDETSEILRESAWKNPDVVPFGWKKKQKFNKENFKEELIDLFHFFINLCMVMGMDAEELFDRYTKKEKINEERNKTGY